MVRWALSGLLFVSLALPSLGQEPKVERVEAKAPAEVAPAIAALLSPAGLKLLQGEKDICEIWLCQEWPIAADAKVGGDVIYPLTPGMLVGAIRYPKKGADFRDQDIPAGVYTLRYGQQPVDGAHVGTSATRDFLVVSPAAKDPDPATVDYKALIALGKETTGSSHPAILSLVRPGDLTEALAVHVDGDHEWTIVRFSGQTKAGAAVKDLALEAVLVGKAAE